MTDCYAVVGHPVAHSLSPLIHQCFADQTQQDLSYDKFDISPCSFSLEVDRFRAQGVCGLNVTVPYKEEAFRYADVCDEQVARAGAVNTLRFEGDECVGFNTDGRGLLVDLIERHSCNLQQQSVLVLGAGGAVRGVLSPLLKSQPGRLVIANRTPGKAQQLVALFRDESGNTEFESASLAEVSGRFDVIINATSLGLDGGTPPIPQGLVENTFCYDMLYGEAAVFQRWALQRGAKDSVDGLGMLVEQAACAFEIWRGIKPQTEPVLNVVRTHLISQVAHDG